MYNFIFLVSAPMLLPTGIYVQPGHPAFLQLHRPVQPPPPQAPSMHPIYPPFAPIRQQSLIPAGQIIQPTRQFLVHPTAQTTFLQPQIPSPYVYMERDDG